MSIPPPDIYETSPSGKDHASDDAGERSTKRALWDGIRNRCPRCGKGAVLHRYLKVRDRCPVCQQDFSGHRADDAPAYFTMLIAGHIVIPVALEVRRLLDPPLGVQFVICSLVLCILVYFLLPITKGGLIGIQWARRMHGFSENAPLDDAQQEADNLP